MFCITYIIRVATWQFTVVVNALKFTLINQFHLHNLILLCKTCICYCTYSKCYIMMAIIVFFLLLHQFFYHFCVCACIEMQTLLKMCSMCATPICGALNKHRWSSSACWVQTYSNKQDTVVNLKISGVCKFECAFAGCPFDRALPGFVVMLIKVLTNLATCKLLLVTRYTAKKCMLSQHID